jgi:hypothetical protein
VVGVFYGALRTERDHGSVDRLAGVTQWDLGVTETSVEGVSRKLVDHDRHPSKLGDNEGGSLFYSLIDDMRHHDPSQPWDEVSPRNGQASQAGGVGPLASIAESLPHEYRGRLWIISPMDR